MGGQLSSRDQQHTEEEAALWQIAGQGGQGTCYTSYLAAIGSRGTLVLANIDLSVMRADGHF